METVQIRLTKKLVEELGELVKDGFYPNKSEAVRDAVRRLIIDHGLGELGEELGELDEKDKDKVGEHVHEMRKYCH